MFNNLLIIFLFISTSLIAGNGDIAPSSSSKINNTSSEHNEQDHPNPGDEDADDKENEKDPNKPCPKEKEKCKEKFREMLDSIIGRIDVTKRGIYSKRRAAGPPSKDNCFTKRAALNDKTYYQVLTELRDKLETQIDEFLDAWDKLQCPCYTKIEVIPVAEEVYAEAKYISAKRRAYDALAYVNWWLRKCRRNRTVGGHSIMLMVLGIL